MDLTPSEAQRAHLRREFRRAIEASALRDAAEWHVEDGDHCSDPKTFAATPAPAASADGLLNAFPNAFTDAAWRACGDGWTTHLNTNKMDEKLPRDLALRPYGAVCAIPRRGPTATLLHAGAETPINLRVWSPKHRGAQPFVCSFAFPFAVDHWAAFVRACYMACEGGAQPNKPVLYTPMGTPLTNPAEFTAEWCAARRRHDGRRALADVRKLENDVAGRQTTAHRRLRVHDNGALVQRLKAAAAGAGGGQGRGAVPTATATALLADALSVVRDGDDGRYELQRPDGADAGDAEEAAFFRFDVVCAEKGAVRHHAGAHSRPDEAAAVEESPLFFAVTNRRLAAFLHSGILGDAEATAPLAPSRRDATGTATAVAGTAVMPSSGRDAEDDFLASQLREHYYRPKAPLWQRELARGPSSSPPLQHMSPQGCQPPPPPPRCADDDTSLQLFLLWDRSKRTEIVQKAIDHRDGEWRQMIGGLLNTAAPAHNTSTSPDTSLGGTSVSPTAVSLSAGAAAKMVTLLGVEPPPLPEECIVGSSGRQLREAAKRFEQKLRSAEAGGAPAQASPSPPRLDEAQQDALLRSDLTARLPAGLAEVLFGARMDDAVAVLAAKYYCYREARLVAVLLDKTRGGALAPLPDALQSMLLSQLRRDQMVLACCAVAQASAIGQRPRGGGDGGSGEAQEAGDESAGTPRRQQGAVGAPVTPSTIRGSIIRGNMPFARVLAEAQHFAAPIHGNTSHAPRNSPAASNSCIGHPSPISLLVTRHLLNCVVGQSASRRQLPGAQASQNAFKANTIAEKKRRLLEDPVDVPSSALESTLLHVAGSIREVDGAVDGNPHLAAASRGGQIPSLESRAARRDQWRHVASDTRGGVFVAPATRTPIRLYSSDAHLGAGALRRSSSPSSASSDSDDDDNDSGGGHASPFVRSVRTILRSRTKGSKAKELEIRHLTRQARPRTVADAMGCAVGTLHGLLQASVVDRVGGEPVAPTRGVLLPPLLNGTRETAEALPLHIGEEALQAQRQHREHRRLLVLAASGLGGTGGPSLSPSPSVASPVHGGGGRRRSTSTFMTPDRPVNPPTDDNSSARDTPPCASFAVSFNVSVGEGLPSPVACNREESCRGLAQSACMTPTTAGSDPPATSPPAWEPTSRKSLPVPGASWRQQDGAELPSQRQGAASTAFHVHHDHRRRNPAVLAMARGQSVWGSPSPTDGRRRRSSSIGAASPPTAHVSAAKAREGELHSAAHASTLPVGVVRSHRGHRVEVSGGAITVGCHAVSSVTGELYRIEGFRKVPCRDHASIPALTTPSGMPPLSDADIVADWAAFAASNPQHHAAEYVLVAHARRLVHADDPILAAFIHTDSNASAHGVHHPRNACFSRYHSLWRTALDALWPVEGGADRAVPPPLGDLATTNTTNTARWVEQAPGLTARARCLAGLYHLAHTNGAHLLAPVDNSGTVNVAPALVAARLVDSVVSPSALLQVPAALRAVIPLEGLFLRDPPPAADIKSLARALIKAGTSRRGSDVSRQRAVIEFVHAFSSMLPPGTRPDTHTPVALFGHDGPGEAFLDDEGEGGHREGTKKKSSSERRLQNLAALLRGLAHQVRDFLSRHVRPHLAAALAAAAPTFCTAAGTIFLTDECVDVSAATLRPTSGIRAPLWINMRAVLALRGLVERHQPPTPSVHTHPQRGPRSGDAIVDAYFDAVRRDSIEDYLRSMPDCRLNSTTPLVGAADWEGAPSLRVNSAEILAGVGLGLWSPPHVQGPPACLRCHRGDLWDHPPQSQSNPRHTTETATATATAAATAAAIADDCAGSADSAEALDCDGDETVLVEGCLAHEGGSTGGGRNKRGRGACPCCAQTLWRGHSPTDDNGGSNV